MIFSLPFGNNYIKISLRGGIMFFLSFGEYVKSLMKLKDIGVNELSSISNISNAHISRIINGKRPSPSPKTIKKLADALSVDYDILMYIAGHTEKSVVFEILMVNDFLRSLVEKEVLRALGAGALPLFSNTDVASVKSVLQKSSLSQKSHILSQFVRNISFGPENKVSLDFIFGYPSNAVSANVENLSTSISLPRPVNPATGKEASARETRQLEKLLEMDGLTFKGAPLSEDDKNKIKAALEIAFWDAKEKNKKK